MLDGPLFFTPFGANPAVISLCLVTTFMDLPISHVTYQRQFVWQAVSEIADKRLKRVCNFTGSRSILDATS